MISPSILSDTDPRIVSDFSQKHGLRVKFSKIDQLFPLSKFSLEWVRDKFYPATHAIDLALPYYLKLAEDKITAVFQGYGGDEIYGSPQLEDVIHYLIQYSYFHRAVYSVKFENIGSLLTKKAIGIILDPSRFAKKKYFPVVVSPSVVFTSQPQFSINWETNIWPIAPFTDPKVIQFARGLPTHHLKSSIKQELWRHRNDIFVRSQFRPSAHMGGLVSKFIEKRKSSILSILENSIMDQNGLIKASQISENLKKSNYNTYLKEGVYMYFLNILYLEYFLQKNNVGVSV